jgi:hypothetical protein
MHELGLTPAEFRQITRCCQRVLIFPHTDVLDLKRFLVTRLTEALPETAARIARFDDRKMADLREEILAGWRAPSASALWP